MGSRRRCRARAGHRPGRRRCDRGAVDRAAGAGTQAGAAAGRGRAAGGGRFGDLRRTGRRRRLVARTVGGQRPAGGGARWRTAGR